MEDAENGGGPSKSTSSLLFPQGDVNTLLDLGSLLLSFKEQVATEAVPKFGSSAGWQCLYRGFLAQACVNFHTKAPLHSLSHPFKQGPLPRELKKHHQLMQDARTLALFKISLADLSPEHHPRIGVLVVTGKQPWRRKWEVQLGADTDLKINAHTTVKTPAWLKIPLTANGRNLSESRCFS